MTSQTELNNRTRTSRHREPLLSRWRYALVVVAIASTTWAVYLQFFHDDRRELAFEIVSIATIQPEGSIDPEVARALKESNISEANLVVIRVINSGAAHLLTEAGQFDIGDPKFFVRFPYDTRLVDISTPTSTNEAELVHIERLGNAPNVAAFGVRLLNAGQAADCRMIVTGPSITPSTIHIAVEGYGLRQRVVQSDR